MSTSARLGFLYLVLTAILLLANGAQAQSYKILHFFAGQLDGSTLRTARLWTQPAISMAPLWATCSSSRPSPTAAGSKLS